LFVLVVAATYEPVWRGFCFVLAMVVFMMFIYMGRRFINAEGRAMDALYKPRQEKGRLRLSDGAKQFIEDKWRDENEME